eukprot:751183-Rhodomonas_salina.1
MAVALRCGYGGSFRRGTGRDLGERQRMEDVCSLGGWGAVGIKLEKTDKNMCGRSREMEFREVGSTEDQAGGSQEPGSSKAESRVKRRVKWNRNERGLEKSRLCKWDARWGVSDLDPVLGELVPRQRARSVGQ